MNIDKDEPVLRSIPMPSDTIAENYVSAGWIMSQMDLAGGKHAYNYTNGRTVTVALNAMSFHQPIFVSDEVSIYGEYLRVGSSSLTIGIAAWAHRRGSKERIKVTEAVFTFVHTDENRDPVLITKRPEIEITPGYTPKGRQNNDTLNPTLTKEQMVQELNKGKEIALKTVPLPRDTNYLGDIFGGWILSQMDLAGLMQASDFANKRVVTVGIEDMVFYNPVFIGNQVTFLTEVVKKGRTSVTLRVESYVFINAKEAYEKVTEGLFSYVAVDENRSPIPI